MFNVTFPSSSGCLKSCTAYTNPLLFLRSTLLYRVWGCRVGDCENNCFLVCDSAVRYKFTGVSEQLAPPSLSHKIKPTSETKLYGYRRRMDGLGAHLYMWGNTTALERAILKIRLNKYFFWQNQWGSLGLLGAWFTLVYCLAYSLILKMEATCSSETSVNLQWTGRCYIQEYMTLRDNGSEKLWY
jgi:hypothetical protein